MSVPSGKERELIGLGWGDRDSEVQPYGYISVRFGAVSLKS